MPDGNDDILKTIDDALGYQPTTTGRKYQSLDVPSIVDDELGNLGYSDNARLALLGNLGRENSWNPNTIFGGHVDPKNGARNRGIISWQGDRQQNLDNFIKSNGGNWWPTEDNLRLQARFLDQELRSKYPYVYKQLTDPNAALPKVSRSLRNYINYSTDPQYNTPDKDFDVANNRIWAQKAQKRGLGSFNTQGVLSTIDDALSTHDSALGAGQQPDQETLSTIDDALNTFDNASGVQPSSTAPTRTPPIGPTEPEQQMPALKPVTEPPQTIQAQVMSMMDKSSPRSAVLITQDDQTPLLKNVSGLTPVQMPEGTLFVNSKKLGIKPKDVPDYVQKNGFAGLIGKVEDVGNNTGQGLALRTEDANGNELSTSIVSPENIAKQAVVDKAQFPQAAKQDVMPAQVAAAKRQISTGNSTNVQQPTKPQTAYGNPVEGAEEDAVLTPEEQASLAKNPAKVPPPSMPKPQPKTAQVIGTADVDPKASDEDQLRQAMQKLLIGRPTPTGPINQDDIENVINIAKQRGLKLIVGSENPGQVTLPEKLYDDILKLKAKSPEQMAEELKQRTIAPPTDDALRQQAIDQLNEERRAGKATNQTDVRFGAEPSQPGQITEDEVQQKMADLRALEPSQEEKSIKYDYAQNESPWEAGVASGLSGAGRALAGVIRPFSKEGYQAAARQSALLEKESGYQNKGQGPLTPYENIADFLGAAGPQLATIVALPGEGALGTIGKFAFLGGAETAGRGGSSGDIGKATLTEGVRALPFAASSAFEKPLAKLGTVFAGSLLANAATGVPIDENFQRSIVNTLYEAQGHYGSKMLGQFYQFWHGGEPLTVGVTPKGDIVIPKNREAIKTENKIVLDPENPVYNQAARRATTEVPTTEAEPEKEQYTSQLDEIRQKGATTKAQVQALFPEANLTREEAADLVRQAYPNAKTNETNTKVSPQPAQVDSSSLDQNTNPPSTTPPSEKGFEITDQTGPEATTGAGKLKYQRDEARREADTDALTGIANRRALDRALPTAESDPNTSIISFDANNFGQVNKQLGEKAGDKALTEIADAFKQAAEENNTGARVFRRGGDEFVMIAPREKAEAIRDRAEQLYGERKYGDTNVSVSGTVGNTFDEANAGLQAAKAERKGRATIPANASQDNVGTESGNNTGEPAASEQGASGETEKGSGQASPETKLPDTGQAKPTATVRSETIKPTGKVFTERGTEADIETRPIPRDKILTSLDEGYPQELQPRDRSRAASRDQINEISGKLNPELLGDSPKASDGRPLVVPVEHDGETKYAVVSGNGRTEAIRNAKGKAADDYNNFVIAKGGKPGDIYAGVLGPKTDLEKFAREANESSTAKMSATEQAAADAKDLDLSTFTPSDNGSIHIGANREFIRKFVGKLPASERGEMMLPDGTLSQTGINRIRNAVFAKAYGDSESGLAVIQRMAESPDDNVKRITAALLQNAPAFADLKTGIEQGSRYPGFDITPDITKAVEKFSFLRENGDSVDEYLKQQNMFGEELTPFQKRMLEVVDTNKNSAKALSGIFRNYIGLVNEIGDPKQIGMFGGTPEQNASTLFKEAVLQYEGGNELQPAANQISLLESDKGGAVQPETSSARSSDVSSTPTETGSASSDKGSRSAEASTSGTNQSELRPGDTVTKDGRIGKVYDRNGELRVRYDRDGKPYSTKLTKDWKAAANPEAGSASVDLLTLGLAKTAKEDVIPAAVEAAKTLADSVDDVRGAIFASGRGDSAKLTALELRKNLSAMARSYDVAEHALKSAREYFAKNPVEDNYDFISKIEGGNISKLSPAEQQMAKDLRRLLDEGRDRVRALGTGKLENFIVNYFPHIWKDPKSATDIFKRILGRRPFEGSKSFLKQRKLETFEDGIKAGLEPVTDNPVDLVLLKLREMEKFVAAHKTLNYLKDTGIAKFVRVGEQPPEGSAAIDDRIGDVYLPPTITKPEYVDSVLYGGLEKLATDLGIKHDRFTTAGPGRIGYSEQGNDHIVSQYATGERVLAHEISHQLDHKYGFIDRFLNNPDKETRAKVKTELRVLADSKAATLDNPEGRKTSYTRKRVEQMAHILEGYVNDRSSFEKKYPTVSKVFNELIDENPELKPIRDLQRSLGKKEMTTEISRGGITKAGQYYAAEPAAKIINNHLSPGLQSKSAYRAWRYAGNVMNQFQLGFSAFHAAFTTLDAVTSKLALAIEQVASGHPVDAAKSTAELPVSWLTNLIRGDKVYKEWLAPGSTDPLHQEMARLMVEAGGRAKMDDFYHTRAATKMLDAFKRGNILGGVLRVPTGAVDLVSRPVMEWLVPRQKLGVFADLARHEMKRLGPDATPEQQREALARVWDSVDNRMGQMVYDNLFWNKTVKDVAMASVRSVGWNLGSVREIGGGVKDVVSLPLRVRRALKEGTSVEPIVTHRMAYIAALPVVTAVVGAMTQYLFTGKGPTELKDYFFPRTGNYDENGRPERLAMPTYIKDVYAYTRHPGNTATHKLHPLIGTVAEMLQNKDYYGTEIRNSDDPVVQQMFDEAKFLGKNFTPFAVQGLMKEQQRKGSTASKILPFFGFTPAPKDVNTTKAEDILSEIQASRREVGSRTKAEAERSQLLADLVREKKRGEDYRTDLQKGIAAGVLKHTDIELIKKRAATDYLSYGVKALPLDDALKVYEAADDKERDKLSVIMKIKAMNAARKGGLNNDLKQKLRSMGLVSQNPPVNRPIKNQ